MRKLGIIAVLSLMALALAAVPALARTNFANAPQGAHYAKGYGEPVCSVSGVTVTCTATQIAGVGNTNATVELDVSNSITGVCRNPGNHNIVDPFTRTRTTSTSTNLTSTKNGRLVVPEQTAKGTSTQQFLSTFTCPNPRWTAQVTSNVLSYEYTLTFAGFDAPAIRITG
jgi:hypothetical protein